MPYLTPEQIADACDNLMDSTKNRKAIDKLYHAQDESHLWPINNRFNATQRAINRTRKFMRDGEYDLAGLEYALAIDTALSEIVNNDY